MNIKIHVLSVFIIILFSSNLKCQDSLSIATMETSYAKAGQYFYKNLDSARYYYEKAFRFAEKNKDNYSKMAILGALSNVDSYHYRLEFLKQDLERLGLMLKNERQGVGQEEIRGYEDFFAISMGNYYYKLKNFQYASKYFHKVLNRLENIPDKLNPYEFDTKQSVLKFLASIASETGKLEKAKEYFQRARNDLNSYQIKGWQSCLQDIDLKYSRIFLQEGRLYDALGMQENTLNNFKSSNSDNGNYNRLKVNYQEIINTLIRLDSLDKAQRYLIESKKLYTENDPFQKKLDLLQGDIYTKKGAYTDAVIFYESALSTTRKYRDQKKHQDIAAIYAKLGSMYAMQGLFDQSLTCYQKGLQQLSDQFSSNQLMDNPEPEKVFSKLELIRILREKLATLYDAYQQKKDTDKLQIALRTSFVFIETLDALKPEFESKVDKQFLIEDVYPAFQEMVAVAHELYIETNDAKYIEDAFYFIEKSRSILLLEATRSTHATVFGEIPEEILDQEQQYRARIVYWEKKRFTHKEDIAVFDSLFSIKNKYYDFIKKIERNYPRYYHLKYANKVNSIQQTVDLIGNEKAVLSFFISDKELFLIAAEKSATFFYKIPFDKTMNQYCTKYYELISRLRIEELPEIYALGNRLYAEILEKPLSKLASKELILIPDGVLNYIPFESLSKVEASPGFLIKTHQISYANSATMLQEQVQYDGQNKSRLIAYAPDFANYKESVSENRADFSPLLFNVQEATQITDYFDGILMAGKAASINSVKNKIKEYSILHFATHAATNDVFPDYSYLALASEKKGVDLLYVKDLYGLSLDADLVTLSACQTGVGTLKKGEGMLSLSRGFTYAGARSLVTTLWNINDRTTAIIMNAFYKGLHNSLSKDEALRKAKLSYLKESEDEFLQHPYYWSGFMISGDTKPLVTTPSYGWWSLLGIIPFLYFVVNRKRKKLAA